MTPSQRYKEKFTQKNFEVDELQQGIIKQFDDLHAALLESSRIRTSWLRRFFSPRKKISGLYLWGKVGVGKTMLMDCFYESLPFAQKKRVHFHGFMQDLHEQLKSLKHKSNPILYLAEQIARETWVLCFDEFFVHDIADAMLLGGMIRCLIENHVCLVATSNVPPDRLYEDGLQRQNFIPTIRLLQSALQVIHVSTMTDYRRNFFENAGVYYTPLNADSEKKMDKAFAVYQKGVVSHEPICLFERLISVKKRTQNVVWFDFETICGQPRCQADYLELAKAYKVVLISQVRKMQVAESDLIINFINLIDVFYDAGVKLILSAETLPQALYQQGRFSFSFQRTQSRLFEMQSQQYVEMDRFS